MFGIGGFLTSTEVLTAIASIIVSLLSTIVGQVLAGFFGTA